MLPDTNGCLKLLVLILPGKNKTSPTISEPNLKQALLNTGQDNGYWPDPYAGFPENGTELHYSGTHKDKTHKSICTLLLHDVLLSYIHLAYV